MRKREEIDEAREPQVVGDAVCDAVRLKGRKQGLTSTTRAGPAG